MGDDQRYQQALKTCKGLAVVNKCAERGVKLVTDFFKAGHTKSEDQLQYLLQVSYKHRKDMPVLTKDAVVKAT